MVATAFPAASEAGCEALRAGGNAVDAAVAAAWALCVCEPSGSGLGGHTVALVHRPGSAATLVDGHSRAPAAVSRRAVTRAQQRAGYTACTIPTTPAVLAHAQRRYGVLQPEGVIAPAIRLAREGYEITPLQRRQLRWCRDRLAATPGGRRFLAPTGAPWRVGDVFRQPGLASALERIAVAGADDFYAGGIARAIVEDMRRNGGLLDAHDLASASEPAEREPLAAPYGAFRLVTAPPPGGGVELLVALKLLAALGGSTPDAAPPDWYARMAVATRAAFTERERRPVEPSQWSQALAAELIDDRRIDSLCGSIHGGTPVTVGAGVEEAGETTHVCAADDDGNWVSLTQSIQSLFGAKVANDRFGFLYNNYLLTCPRRRHAYRLRASGPARSNAAPTLVVDGDARPLLAAGGAGSRRIVSAMAHLISGVLDRGASLGEAVATPRVHARVRGAAWVERDALTPDLRLALERAGLEAAPKPPLSFCMGSVQAIARQRDGTLVGACDPRREGEPRGV